MVDTPQVFCDVCHRGVLINQESMYKCEACARQVCGTCWDSRYNICSICSQPYRLEEQKRSAEKQKAEEEKKIYELNIKKEKEKAEEKKKISELQLKKREEEDKKSKRNFSCSFVVICSLLALFLLVEASVSGKFWWWLFVIDCIIAIILFIYFTRQC